MNELDSFKALHEGVGHNNSEAPSSSSYYDIYDEDQLLSTSTTDTLSQQKDTPIEYDTLIKRLERPILDSLTPSETQMPREKKKIKKEEPIEEVQIFSEQNSAVNSMGIPSWKVLKMDFSFSLGLYLLSGVILSLLIGLPSTLSSWFFVVMGYGAFHQAYLVLTRSILKSSVGEDYYNLHWPQSSASSIILRGLILTFTGFLLIPFFSALLKKDLLKEYTGLYLEYNV